MSTESRVEKLERKVGTDDAWILAVVWGDTVTVGSETLTLAEFDARYPEAHRRIIEWPEGEG